MLKEITEEEGQASGGRNIIESDIRLAHVIDEYTGY